jgi:hypothetical protein
VSELEQEWDRLLAEAERRARSASRGDVADYLALRASNDLMRRTAITWLITTFTDLAGEANRAGGSIQVERQEVYRFPVGNSTMVGQLLKLRSGVRSITIEAGWPRVPSDGIVRGGGLACARIKHFGDRRSDEELLLVRARTGAPQWAVLEETGAGGPLLESRAHQHVRRLLKEA